MKINLISLSNFIHVRRNKERTKSNHEFKKINYLVHTNKPVKKQENLEYELILMEDNDIDDVKDEFDTIQILKHDKA